MTFKLLVVLMGLSLSQNAWSFVQNVTHGYPACIACHVSPNGGGLLTDYGRSLSKELMSTWGVSDGFAKPFFGALKNRDSLKWGGDLRTIQTYLDNNNVNQGKLFAMQQNVEAGVRLDNVMLVGTVGLQQGPQGSPRLGQFLSERHYALWSPSQTSRVKLGKYRQTFGINTPNHARLIKSLFGFGALSETYNLEFTQYYETYQITLASSLGRIDNPRTPDSEQSLSGHYTYYLNGNSRIGASVLMGESTNKRRTLAGINAVLPLSKNWLLMSEMDYEKSHFASNPQQAVQTVASFFRMGYTPIQGIMAYLLYEHASIDRGNSYSLTQKPGFGFQWLPVPHINLQLEYQRSVADTAIPGAPGSYQNPNNIGFIMLHTYL